MVRFGTIAIATLGLGLSLALGACGSADDNSPPDITVIDPPTSTVPSVQDAPRPAVAFAACASCHTVTPGQNGIGPSLAGVFGRKAGMAPGFVYSEAMKDAGKTWDEATLDTYLANPMGVVPGTRMTYMGQSDPAKRKAVIEYLKTLK